MTQRFNEWRGPLLVGLIGWLAVVLTRTDPGITSDEPFSVLFGMDMVDRFCERGVEFFSRQSISETFATRSEHPPFGRWIFGWMHRLLNGPPESRSPFNVQDILDARVATATVFGVMLVVLGRVVGSRHGPVAGRCAALGLALMPRVFADAHFAALDTIVSCTNMLAVFAAAWMMERRRPWLAAPCAGIFLGAALLTKMHGVLLLPLVGLWAIACHRVRGLIALVPWFLSGALLFIAGWQHLWGHVNRLIAFLSSSVDREAIYVLYGGRVYRDTDLPWHYPWVLFAVTVPVGLHMIGLCGVWRHWKERRSDPRGWLYFAAAVFPLIVFSVPGIPVYDGVRLFLMVFPFWAVFIGQGAAWVYERLKVRWHERTAAAVLGGFLVCQGFGLWYYHPFQLSYYNLLVGGLRGAERLGFEVTYWGDSVTEGLIDRWAALAPQGSCAVLQPTLYTEQGMLYMSAAAQRKELRIRASLRSPCPYLIVYNRRAYLSDVRAIVDDASQKPLVENAVDGVWLSRIYVRSPANPPDAPDEPASKPR